MYNDCRADCWEFSWVVRPVILCRTQQHNSQKPARSSIYCVWWLQSWFLKNFREVCRLWYCIYPNKCILKSRIGTQFTTYNYSREISRGVRCVLLRQPHHINSQKSTSYSIYQINWLEPIFENFHKGCRQCFFVEPKNENAKVSSKVISYIVHWVARLTFESVRSGVRNVLFR